MQSINIYTVNEMHKPSLSRLKATYLERYIIAPDTGRSKRFPDNVNW